MTHQTPALEGSALDQALEERIYPRITVETIRSKVKDVSYLVIPGTTVTLCNVTLQNGYTVRGESACVDPRNFDKDIGEAIAYKDALRQIWPLEGYLLAEDLYAQRTILADADEALGARHS